MKYLPIEVNKIWRTFPKKEYIQEVNQNFEKRLLFFWLESFTLNGTHQFSLEFFILLIKKKFVMVVTSYTLLIIVTVLCIHGDLKQVLTTIIAKGKLFNREPIFFLTHFVGEYN